MLAYLWCVMRKLLRDIKHSMHFMSILLPTLPQTDSRQYLLQLDMQNLLFSECMRDLSAEQPHKWYLSFLQLCAGLPLWPSFHWLLLVWPDLLDGSMFLREQRVSLFRVQKQYHGLPWDLRWGPRCEYQAIRQMLQQHSRRLSEPILGRSESCRSHAHGFGLPYEFVPGSLHSLMVHSQPFDEHLREGMPGPIVSVNQRDELICIKMRH